MSGQRRLVQISCLLLLGTGPLSAQALPVVDEYGNFRQLDDRPVGVLRIRAQCGPGGDLSRSHILAQEAEESESLRKNDRDPAAWYALACSRALLFAADGRAREGLLMPPSTSWANGAVSAAVRALAIDSLHGPSSELLASLALETAPNAGAGAATAGGLNLNHPDRTVDPARSARAIVRAARADGNRPSPLVLRACVSLSLHLEPYDRRDATACADRALRMGYDSTWHLLRFAYMAFRGIDLPLGNRYFEAAVAAAHTPQDRAEIGWHLYGRSRGWFGDVQHMQPWQRMERTEWSALLTMPDSAFLPWVRARNEVLGRRLDMGADRLGHHFHAVIHHASGFRDCANYVGKPEEGGKACGSLRAFNLTRGQLAPAAAAYRLFSPRTGARVIAVPLVLPGGDVTNADSANSLLAELALWEAGPNRWRNAQLELAVPLGRERAMVGGVLSIPDSGGTLAWQLSVRDQLRGKSGSVIGESPDLSGGSVRMSDIVLGSQASAVRWTLEGRELLLPPSSRFTRQEPVRLYLQMWSDVPPGDARVELAVFGTRQQDTMPRLQLAFPHRILERFTELERDIDFARLGKGEYRLQVTVRVAGGGLLAKRESQFTVE